MKKSQNSKGKRQKFLITFFTFYFLFFTYQVCFSEDGKKYDLGKIVVTPYRYEESLSKAPASVSVITQEDIKNSNASKVVDVIRGISGVTVRDWYGSGTAATVDIGGFGEQAALNVLVLVDGRRVNDVDLSGVDWTQVPIDQVERIEVVRGGTGGVLYGDNASSGVINIITKKGSGKPKVNLKAEYGSYYANAQALSLGGGVDNKFSYYFDLRRDATNGYRKNSFAKNNNLLTKMGYDFNDAFSAHFDAGFHDSDYGMPASLTQSVIDQYGRRYSRYGDDHAHGKDYYFLIGPRVKFAGAGDIDIDFNYRRKKVISHYLSSGLDTSKNRTETFGVMPKYTLGNTIFDRDNKLITGVDFYHSLYSSKTLYYSQASPALNGQLNQYSDINKNSFAGYLQDEFPIFEQLVLASGYRYEAARYAIDYHDNDLHSYGKSPDLNTKIKPNMDAYNAGLSYNYKDDSSVFFNAGRSFRFPEVDEFTYIDQNWQKQVDTDLKPQNSMNYQAGLRHKLSEQVRGSLSLFRMNVKDEIYMNAKDFLSYGYWNGRNRNYDKTVHKGIEASLDVKPKNWVTLYGNYTFTDAYFDGGQYDKNKIPLVPQDKAMIGLKLLLPQNITFNITDTYTGKRYFLNDQANAYSQLNGYMVADTNLSWRYKDFTATFCINNFLNKKYSEYAGVLVDSVSKFYYPSPERNFNLKVDYNF